MARFCGKCGTPLDSNGMCPRCEINVEQKYYGESNPDYNNIPASSDIDPTYPNNINENEPAPKPKSKKSLILRLALIGSGAVAVVLLVLLAFSFDWFGLGKSGELVTSQSDFFSETSCGKILGKYNLSLIAETEKKESEVSISDDMGSPARMGPVPSYMAKDGDVFYGREGDDLSKFYKITLKNVVSCEKEEWITEEQLKKSVLSYNEGYNYAYDIGNFMIDGDYVYGCVLGWFDYRTIHFELNGRIFRISKNGDVIEFVGDENTRAVEFVMSGGWIYYVDNGYTFNGKEEYDKSRVGIYKMKTDGSQKTKLTEAFAGLSGNYERNEYGGNAGALTLWGDKLYYLDFSSGESILYRMDLDGSGKEKLSDRAVSMYTIDTAGNKIYYIPGNYQIYYDSFDSSHDLYKIDLNSKINEPITSVDPDSNIDCMDYDSGFIYFYRYSKGISDKGIKRLELATGKVQYVYYKLEGRKVEYDEFGFPNVIDEGKTVICWKTDENFDSI